MGKAPVIIAAVLVEKDGKFLLREELLESGKKYWIIPGGHVEFGETIRDAAVREIKEETGIDVKITGFIGHEEVIRTQFDYHTVIFFFRGMPCDGNIIETKDARFFSSQEIENLNLVDSAKTIFRKLGI
jgi:8-oxo-dGTP diphosphatase